MKRVYSKTSNGKSAKRIKSVEKEKTQKEFQQSQTEEKMFIGKKQKRQRQENSLDELTRSFINYVKETKSSVININDIVKKLKVKKRRIYDITNVLEGK